MTKNQILTFCIIARCCFAKMAANVGLLMVIGDPSFEQRRTELLLVNSFLKTIKCYDPDYEGNCLTNDEMLVIINRTAQLLGICGDPLSLQGTASNCCNPLYGITIANP